MRHLIAFSCWSAVLAGAGIAQAHDVGGLDHESARRSLEVAKSIDPRVTSLSADTRSVISRLALWTPGSKLMACFIEGSPEIRAKIVKIANQWIAVPGVNLSIDFGAAPGFRDCSGSPVNKGRYEDIRIGFRASGYWSYVGIDSHQPGLGANPSMNLENFDTIDPATAANDHLVLHEFGHALGMEHEHQSPPSTCSAEFDLPRIQASLHWSDAMMARNFKPLDANSRLYEWSPWDSESIMMYSLPPEYFKTGIKVTCLVAQSKKLSDKDQIAIQRAYPAKAPGSPPVNRSIDANTALGFQNLPDALKDRAKLSKQLDN